MKVKMSEKYSVTMGLTQLELLVLSALIEHVKLGDSNVFESALSDIAIDLDNWEPRNAIQAAREQYGDPKVTITASMEDGITINLE